MCCENCGNAQRVDPRLHLSFKDILLEPFDQHPCVTASRNDPDIFSEICPGKRVAIPIISAPMDTITGVDMAITMASLGTVGVLTRYINNPDELNMQIQNVSAVSAPSSQYSLEGIPGKNVYALHVAVAIGVKDRPEEKAKKLVEAGATIICLDIANGNHILMLQALEKIKHLNLQHKNGAVSIIAGNVATPQAAIRLANAGADAVKIGIGPGACCSTRRVTGFGNPQLSALLECAPALRERNVRVISDGGIRTSGDVAKAIWAGADTVMVGYILSGHEECPKTSLTDDGQRIYRGMASRTVSKRSDIAAEGVCIKVPNRGSVVHTLKEYAAAIKTACSFANATNLEAFRHNVRAIRVSTMSQEESDPVRGEQCKNYQS